MGHLHHQVEIDDRAQGKCHRFEGKHADRAPPGQRAGTESVIGELCQVHGKVRWHHPSRSIDPVGLGQNQPINVMATGTAPMYRPQGVKIVRMNRRVAARAARSGQMLGSADGSNKSGLASPAVVSNSSRRSVRNPKTRSKTTKKTHSGSDVSATGICAKL